MSDELREKLESHIEQLRDYIEDSGIRYREVRSRLSTLETLANSNHLRLEVLEATGRTAIVLLRWILGTIISVSALGIAAKSAGFY